ncbi:hypothetical protein KSP40_PGU018687 [Platanthera guangdongensis]|uniref:Uncharacterized protein n=1 Tax=Platanthera guangdongensis TaxID=2320717 RepID=A0ABR2MN34_9ASPA
MVSMIPFARVCFSSHATLVDSCRVDATTPSLYLPDGSPTPPVSRSPAGSRCSTKVRRPLLRPSPSGSTTFPTEIPQKLTAASSAALLRHRRTRLSLPWAPATTSAPAASGSSATPTYLFARPNFYPDLERIVGTSAAGKMRSSEKATFVFC